MQKCGKKVICGDIAYNGDEEIETLRINVKLFSKQGKELTPITFDLTEEEFGGPLVKGTHAENLEFPIEEKFGFFRIEVQIDPEDEDEYEEENDED